MIKTPPIETQQIFETLTKGHFISGDSSNTEMKKMFGLIDNKEEDNYETLLNYFGYIGFQLLKGDSYYYFAKKETGKKLEDKLKLTYKWIDILEFFMTFGESINEYFSPGKIFIPNDILTQCKVNNALMDKLYNIKLTKQIDKPIDKITRLTEELTKATFVEIHNEFYDEYKVLAAFKYLEELINTIDITIEDEETIPE